MATSVPLENNRSHQRRRRNLYEDPFPITSTTNTPLIPASDLLAVTDESENPSSHATSPTPVRNSSTYSPLPKSATPLRPAQDVLNRLIWDTSLQQGTTLQTEYLEKNEVDDKKAADKEFEYVIGYLDRFTGIQQVTLDEWIQRRKDRDGEDWVPLHRVMWMKRRERRRKQSRPDDRDHQEAGDVGSGEAGEEAEVIWDRAERIDLIFQSGNSYITASGLHDRPR